MTVLTEWRDDDHRAVGFCPKCATQLVNVSEGGKGYCDDHGVVFANWSTEWTGVCADCGTSHDPREECPKDELEA